MTTAKSVQKSVQNILSVMYSKTDYRYWEQRVFLPSRKKNGEVITAKSYSVKIQHEGRRETFATKKSSKREAGKEAVKIFHSLNAVG